MTETSPESKDHLNFRMALAPVSDAQVDYLYDRLLVSRPEELLTIRLALERYQDAIKDRLWTALEDRNFDTKKRMRAACAGKL